MEFNLGEFYEFKENHVLTSRIVILKGTKVKIVDIGSDFIGLEFPQYSDYFHNCAGNTKSGYGYYFEKSILARLVKKAITKKNNLEVYKNVRYRR